MLCGLMKAGMRKTFHFGTFLHSSPEDVWLPIDLWMSYWIGQWEYVVKSKFRMFSSWKTGIWAIVANHWKVETHWKKTYLGKVGLNISYVIKYWVVARLFSDSCLQGCPTSRRNEILYLGSQKAFYGRTTEDIKNRIRKVQAVIQLQLIWRSNLSIWGWLVAKDVTNVLQVFANWCQRRI